MSTDIEKKSLEAHVELCAERYKNLEDKLQNLDARMGKIEGLIVDIKNAIASSPNESNKTLITIGTAIVAALIGGLITLVVHIK
jgi:predicted  nucleic acid-binding Zn-ribbon protein